MQAHVGHRCPPYPPLYAGVRCEPAVLVEGTGECYPLRCVSVRVVGR